MKNKLYTCELPNCNNQVKIRSTIKNKDSEYYGLKACPRCASTHNLKKQKEYKPRQKSAQSKRTEARRREERKDFPEFFQRHIEIARGKCCAECGTKLIGHVSEIAHIIKKSSVGGNPEVSTEDANVLPLCQYHHNMFDSSLEKRAQMKCFPQALEQYRLIRDKIQNWNTSEVRFFESYLKDSQ